MTKNNKNLIWILVIAGIIAIASIYMMQSTKDYEVTMKKGQMGFWMIRKESLGRKRYDEYLYSCQFFNNSFDRYIRADCFSKEDKSTDIFFTEQANCSYTDTQGNEFECEVTKVTEYP